VFPGRSHRIAADLTHLSDAREFAAGAAAEFGLDDFGCYRVKLAVSEAVANAIQHGSDSPGDTVEILAAEEAGALALYVRDEGRFVPRVATRGALPESGRGLEFMGQLMDEIEVRPGSAGTEVRLAVRP
jgi:anti-sigma regulatory factor (Ser/Thr protein kinase)